MANCAHLPVENANDPGFRLVEDYVVNFVVAVHERRPVLRLRLWLLEEADHLVVVWNLSDWLASVFVLCLRLTLRYGRKSLDLSVIEATLTTKLFQANTLGLDAVELGQRGDSTVPHLSSVLRAYIGNRRVFEDAAVEEGHDVECSADDRVIFAETEGLWYWNIGVLEGVEDAVLAIDLMGGFGQKLSRGLLAHDILLSIRRLQQVCWVALAIAELS